MAEALSYKFIKPVSGGGLGDCKIGIIELNGEYATGGIDVGLTKDPLFAFSDSGYSVKIESNKLVLKTAGAEVTAATDVSGVKVLIVIKGAA